MAATIVQFLEELATFLVAKANWVVVKVAVGFHVVNVIPISS